MSIGFRVTKNIFLSIFKNDALMMGNAARSGSPKRIFRKAAMTLLVPVDCNLCVLKPYYVYEKCSSDVSECIDIKTSDIRRANQILRNEKSIFIDFHKMIPPLWKNNKINVLLKFQLPAAHMVACKNIARK